MVDPVAQHHPAGPVFHGQQQDLVVDRIGHDQQRQVLAAGDDGLADRRGRDGFRVARGQDRGQRLAADERLQFLFALGTRRPHGDAAVAQSADDRFRRLDAVVDDHEAQRLVLSDGHGVRFSTRCPRPRPWRTWHLRSGERPAS